MNHVGRSQDRPCSFSFSSKGRKYSTFKARNLRSAHAETTGAPRKNQGNRPAASARWRQASLPAVEPGFPARRKKPHANQGALESSHEPKTLHAFPGGRDAALYVRQGCLTLRRWRQASLPAVEPGFPARRKKPHANQGALESSHEPKTLHAFPGGRDAALYVRQGCLTLRRWRQASLPAVEPGFPARRKKPHANQGALECSHEPKLFTPFRAAGMPPSTSGKDA